MLIKQTYSQRHNPDVVATQTFPPLAARKIFDTMTGSGPNSETGRQLVKYLWTVVGKKRQLLWRLAYKARIEADS